MARRLRTEDHIMTAHYTEALRADRQPTNRALAMTKAVAQHLADVLDDDPGDSDDLNKWSEAHEKARELAAILTTLMRRS